MFGKRRSTAWEPSHALKHWGSDGGETRDLGDQAATKRFQLFVSEAIEYICQITPH
jgi:hypothetical protein